MLALIERIRQEYLALPGLKLTVAQARRLWPARDGVFTAAMDTLAAEGFLRYLPSGSYIAVPRPDGTAANAELALRHGGADGRRRDSVRGRAAVG